LYELIKKLRNFTLKSKCIFSLLLFLVSDRDLFMEIMNIISYILDKVTLAMPLANLIVYQQGIHYSGIKLYTMLPREIKSIAGNPNKFKQA